MRILIHSITKIHDNKFKWSIAEKHRSFTLENDRETWCLWLLRWWWWNQCNRLWSDNVDRCQHRSIIYLSGKNIMETSKHHFRAPALEWPLCRRPAVFRMSLNQLSRAKVCLTFRWLSLCRRPAASSYSHETYKQCCKRGTHVQETVIHCWNS